MTEKYWTVRKLSELSGVSFSAINAIENGKQSPTLSTLELIAKGLDCKIKDLFDED